MIKKTITYTDYNGVERTEDFYFNLSRAEIMELQLSASGGFGNWVNSIIEAHNENELWHLFTDIVAKSYGVRSSDGRQFHKSEEITKKFMETEAYSEFIVELINDDKAASEFMSGLLSGVAAKPDKPSLTVK